MFCGKQVQLFCTHHCQKSNHDPRDFLEGQAIVSNLKSFFNYSIISFDIRDMHIWGQIVHYDARFVSHRVHYGLEFVVAIDSLDLEISTVVDS